MPASSITNNLDGRLTNFWDVLRNTGQHQELLRRLSVTPFSEVEWKLAVLFVRGNTAGERLDRAFHFFIYCRQSMAGRMACFAPLSRERTRRGMNEPASAWLSAVEGLPEVHERLKRVVVYNSHALDVIAKEDGPGTRFYCDPPYVQEARVAEAQATKEDIANAFHVPLAYLTKDTNMANIQASAYQHMTLAVRLRLQRRDEKINEQLLPLYDPSGRLFVASEDPVPESQDAILKQQEIDLKMGVKAINEVRQERGLPPVDWGHTPWLPLNWKPTDRHIAEQSINVTDGD